MTQHFNALIVASAAMILVAGCSEPYASTAMLEPVVAPVPASRSFQGTVRETMNAGGYTYVKVSNDTKSIWAAVPEFEIQVGAEVVVPEGAPMPNFRSDALDRTFELVYFCSAILRPGDAIPMSTSSPIAAGNSMPTAGPIAPGSSMPAGHPSIGGSGVPTRSTGLPTGHPVVETPPVLPVDVPVLKQPEGSRSIVDIFASKAELGGQQITVRGTVVKYNAQILGKNWFHLQDGSGAAGNNDLTVTTSQAVRVGDVVVATGVIAIRKDFGAGYYYDVILEDAAVTVETPPER